MARNTLKDVVREARKRGISVSYKVRKDGGIRITQAFGRKADQDVVNYLRALTGMELSGRQQHQRDYARSNILPKNVRREYARLREALAQNPQWLGHLRRETVKLEIRNIGAEATAESIAQYRRRVEGYVLYEDMEALAGEIRLTARNASVVMPTLEGAAETVIERLLQKASSEHGIRQANFGALKTLIYLFIQTANKALSAHRSKDEERARELALEAMQKLQDILNAINGL